MNGLLELARTLDPTLGGNEAIVTGLGRDLILAGNGDDAVIGGDGGNVVIGDNGKLTYGVAVLRRVETSDSNQGGNDTVTTGTGADLVLGGMSNDAITTNAGNDIVLGDNGFVDYVSGDNDPSDLDIISTNAPLDGGSDNISTGAGNDIVLAGTAGDTASGGDNNDLIFGDHAEVTGSIHATLLPLNLAVASHPFSFRSIDTQNNQGRGDDNLTGNDVIFGEGQDDDLYGGTDYDRIHGGAGEDSIIGDDGRMATSRNGLTEPLYGRTVADTQQSIGLSGNFTGAVVNITGRIKKTPDLIGFDIGSNDILYGGIGDDFIHGGAGDDAISGAEATAAFYNSLPQTNSNPLQYNPATTKFALYDADNPRTKIANFLLNFDATNGDGVKINDGKDHRFGDLGNDWIVGGTMNDR